MRRLLTLAAFLLIFSIVPMCAQRGGGHASGGGHAGFGGPSGFSGHVSASPRLGASHSSSISGSHFASSARYGARERYRGRRGREFRYTSRYGFPYYGYPYYGYPYYGYYDPWLDSWWWDSGYPSDDQVQDRALADQMNQENLEEQDMLRQQDQDAYARPARLAQPSADERAENEPATVLVFRDQRQREIRNYAIADGILWNFAASRTEKIPLAVLDIPATIKANEERGVEFRLPQPREGQ